MSDKLSNGLAKADELANDLANDKEIIRGLERMREEDPDGFSSDVLNYINSLKAEIEQLKANSVVAKLTMKNIDVAHIKAEAIKEFAERLKNKSGLLAPSVYAEPFRAVSVEEIDNLVAEMTEDNNAE